ncbi:hypothetical protein [Fibrobacter sp. UWB12]|uniref:InlB B-repeat-containing protein n=1 Tax=Fibrobacter sp. UWB12 TaxID=1896203 RepID=UPI00091F30CD|nr:hypothetical protein [Fibrobacter sp. UWB12]SHK58501.1 Por secretion system C-terminal sorting domain-containing protein [Fibrobacter sp. UWB12]
MRKNICLGLGATLAFAVSVYAQEYKINKVGSNEEQSFNVLLNQTAVTQAAAGTWLDVTPIVPDGKVFKGFTVYDEYGMFPNQQRVSTTTKEETRFLMPDHDVYVKASYESLRYSLVVNSTDNGRVLITFNDRTRDRTKPGTKVTVTPNPSDGYITESITVSKKQDDSTFVDCVKDTARVDGSCSFDMPYFDVLVSANFVPIASSSSNVEVVSSSSAEVSSSSAEIASNSSSSRNDVLSSSSDVVSSSSAAAVSSSSDVAASSSSAVESSSSVVPASSSDVAVSSSNVVASSSSVAPASSSAVASCSSAEIASNSSSSRNDVSSSSSAVASSSSAKPASSSAVASSSSAKANSSSSAKQSSSSAKPASSSSKPASSSAKSSSSIADVVVEAVATEEDLPSCTVKRENMTYYVSTLKAVFVCHSRMWTRYNPGPNALPIIAFAPKFSAVANGRSLQISGAKVGSLVSLFDMQGRVIYSSLANAANFSMNVPRSGSYLLRVGTLQKVVNIR